MIVTLAEHAALRSIRPGHSCRLHGHEWKAEAYYDRDPDVPAGVQLVCQHCQDMEDSPALVRQFIEERSSDYPGELQEEEV